MLRLVRVGQLQVDLDLGLELSQSAASGHATGGAVVSVATLFFEMERTPSLAKERFSTLHAMRRR